MLQLILGISGTGKTERTLAEIKVRALAGKKSILLAPEQFSSSAEMMLYSRLGDELSAFAEAYSFTRFAELVLKTFGGVAALLSMLNSCASGVSVVNIDNGFGAAYTAAMICRRG